MLGGIFMMRRKYPFSFSEIAAAAGVSTATISRVLNDQSHVKPELVEKVYHALSEKGINPNDYIIQTPSSGKNILFVLPFDFNSFFNEIIKGAKASAIQHGYTMMILQEHINSNTYPSFESLIKSTKIAGVISLNHINVQIMHALTSLVPVVQCCDYDPDSTLASSVSLDDFSMGYTAVSHLLAQGRKKIAFMSGSLKYRDNFVRQQGYLKALQDAGIKVLPRWIINLPEINYNMASSTATHLLSQQYRPDAFLAISDLYACAIINAARQLGLKVPQDLMVIGYDNVDYAIISSPSITTINTPKYQMGYTASELLIDHIQNPSLGTQHINLQSELVIRESSSFRSGR